MKIRTDFVSNSSSSSFIVAAEDNKLLLILPKPTVLTFKEYFDRFGDNELEPALYASDDGKRIKYVPTDEFVGCFLKSIHGIFPKCLKPKLTEYLSLNANLRIWQRQKKDTKCKYELIEDILYDERSALRDEIHNAIYSLLEPQYKDMMFCYEEVEDNDYYCAPYGIKDIDGIMSDDNANKAKVGKIQELRRYNVMCQGNDGIFSNEDLCQARIDYLDALHPLKFVRRFSNH